VKGRREAALHNFANSFALLRTMKKYALLAAALLALAACSQSDTSKRVAAIAAGSPAPQSSNDPAHVIDQYVVGINTDFADLQGDPTKQSGGYNYYRATKPLPGASNCSVYVDSKSGDRFGSCDFNAPDLGSAKKLYDTWISNIESAEYYWKQLDVSPLPAGVAEATLFADDKETRGIYATVSSTAPYHLTITFAKMSALRS
jgi:hypothetical protein